MATTQIAVRDCQRMDWIRKLRTISGCDSDSDCHGDDSDCHDDDSDCHGDEADCCEKESSRGWLQNALQ